MPAIVSYVGIDMTLYRNTGTFGSPTWLLIDIVRDNKVAQKKGEADVSRRKIKVRQFEPTIEEKGLEFQIIRDEADTNYTALQSAYDANTIVEFAICNGPIANSGQKYLRCEMKIFGFDQGEPLDGANTTDVTAKPCYSANAPSRTTVP